MMPNRSRQHNLFEIPPFSNQIVNGIRMTDPNDILFNDWAGVQLRRHIVTGRTNNFHSMIVRRAASPSVSAPSGMRLSATSTVV